MTLPPVIRIFFALDLPMAQKEKIGKLIGSLKKVAKSHAIRWTKSENLHITLQFLAEVQSADLNRLSQNVKQHLNSKQQIKLKLGNIQLFPSPYRPRVIVLSVEPQAELAMLAEQVGKGIIQSDYAIDTRPFRAHLTLGRIKQPQGVDLHFLNEVEPIAIDETFVEEIIMFRSEPQPDGSAYTALERISLFESEAAVM